MAVVAAVALGAACGSSGGGTASPSSTSNGRGAPRPSSTGATPTAGAPVVTGDRPCSGRGAPPRRYRSVVVFSFENRTWRAVGPGFEQMPYLRTLARRCAWFTSWDEADPSQNSLSQYVGQVTGAPQPGTVDDCSPSARCSTGADNLFRQARRAGLSAVDYVEGATTPCSAEGNAAKHVPALYMWGDDDRSHCGEQVRPLTELDPERLPAFAFVTPDLCHDGHDCGNDAVDRWASAHVAPVLRSAAYRAGKVAVFIWYDEDRPVPNLWLAPTARAGPVTLPGAGYAGTLAAWESMLGLPCLAHACHAADMRAAADA